MHGGGYAMVAMLAAIGTAPLLLMLVRRAARGETRPSFFA
jgi:hypothetical protein